MGVRVAAAAAAAAVCNLPWSRGNQTTLCEQSDERNSAAGT
jgi:hypothetical protein